MAGTEYFLLGDRNGGSAAIIFLMVTNGAGLGTLLSVIDWSKANPFLIPVPVR